MKRIWVLASLRRAQKHDIVIPSTAHLPEAGEVLKDNNLFFLKCPVRGRFVGIQTFWNHQDPEEALELYKNSALYMFKEKVDFNSDQMVFDIRLEQAEPDQVFDLPGVLKFGLVYFRLKEGLSAAGPLYLSPDTNLMDLNAQLAAKKIYLVSKAQPFVEIKREKTA